MSSPILAHPSATNLTAFANGNLDDGATEAVAAHLAECVACRQTIEDAGCDSFADRVKAAAPRSITSEDLPPELADHPRYRILRKLGEGGMGTVYQAKHKVMDRLVAIKVIARGFVDHPDALARFHREVKAAAQLTHPNIATAYDAEQVGNLHTLVMEFVEGQSLDQVLERKGPFPVNFACGYIRQAALGLQHALEQGMVHRDIKPQNMMLTPKGQIKLLDFGLARMASERDMARQLTAAGAYMGTPEFMAPEQATDARTADIRADIYSLGCTLFYLLTARPPFLEDTHVKMALAHITQEPPSLSELRSDAPTALIAILARMLAKEPADRYQTPMEVAQVLAPFTRISGKGIAMPPVQPIRGSAHGTLVAVDTPRPPSPVKTGGIGLVATPSAKPTEDSLHSLPAEPGKSQRNWGRVAVIGLLSVIALGLFAVLGVVTFFVVWPKPAATPIETRRAVIQPAPTTAQVAPPTPRSQPTQPATKAAPAKKKKK